MSVYLRRWENKSGKHSAWYVQFVLNGETVHERARDPDTEQEAWTKTDAKTCEAKMRARLQSGTLRAAESPTLAEFIRRVYLPWAAVNHTASHYQSDRWRTAVLIAELGEVRLDQLSTFTVERFKRRHLDETTKRGGRRSPASVNRLLQLLSKIFSMAIAAKQVDGRPEITLLREDNQRLRYLTIEEEQRLRAVMAKRAPYLLDLLIVGVNTGLRAGELFRLRKVDVDLNLSVIHVLESKSGRPRQVPIYGECRAVLARICAEQGSEQVFASPRTGGKLDNVKKGFRACCKAAAIEGVTPHTLRHTYGTRLAAAGVDIATIKELMGHSDIKTTTRYMHAISERRHDAARRLAGFVEAESRMSHALIEKREA